MLSKVNLVLKAVFAGLGAFISILVGATSQAAISWGDISVNTWLTAVGAFIATFATVYFVPNSNTVEEKK